MSGGAPTADVCLILEGAYPYVTGGVSGWMHDLIRSQGDVTFHLVALVADDAPRRARYELPANVLSFTEIVLQRVETEIPDETICADLMEELEPPLRRLLSCGGLEDFTAIIETLRRHPYAASRAAVMNSEAAFGTLERMYQEAVPGSSFLNYFWSWRSLLGGLFAVLLADLPPARLYHTISTGYAGLLMARAAVETGRPGLLTEHGIYTNERRIEIATADWLMDNLPGSLDIENRRHDLRDVWVEAFAAYSRVCYEACSRIVTLYGGNQALQLRDGASSDRMMIIPNGIDYDALSRVPRQTGARRPTVALIGRVVPIKDIKTYIRAAALLREMVPDVHVLVLGPADEDAEYSRECRDMVDHLGLQETLEFTGRVKLADYLGRVDVTVLTSISEAQPLVLLEAGASGIPCVATDVGSCSEIVHGLPGENPPLGPGGSIVPLADPLAVATAVADLLRDPALRARCGEAIRRRVEMYYNKTSIDRIYAALYQTHLAAPDRAMTVEA